MTRLHIVAAIAQNLVIGDTQTNDLPWKLPSDLKHFKETTKGKTVVMGRRTFESLRRPLPDRKNIVITKDPILYESQHIITCADPYGLLRYAQGELYIIGGAKLFEIALKLKAEHMHLTRVLQDATGDVRFPADPEHMTNYEQVSQSEVLEENGIRFQFVEYVRKTQASDFQF